MSRSAAPQRYYKRNQVEEALWALLSGPSYKAADRLQAPPPPYFKARLKRLLETDVMKGRQLGTRLPEYGMAFFDALPKGKGTDVKYTPERIFNLAIGLQLVAFGCKPSEVVEAISQLKELRGNLYAKVNKRVVTTGRMRYEDIDPKTNERLAIFLILFHVEAPRAMTMPSGFVSQGETFLAPSIADSRSELQKAIEKRIPNEASQLHIMELAEMAARITELLKLLPARTRGPKKAVYEN